MQHDYAGRGLGTQLMQTLIGYARSQGILELTGLVLRENAVMLDLCHRLGFQLEPLVGESDTVSARLTLSDIPVT